MRGSAGRTLVLVLGMIRGPGLVAQELPFLRDDERSDFHACREVPDPLSPSDAARAQAVELASVGDRALILGDFTRAEALFYRAVELDPESAELAYRHARVLEELAEGPTAMAEYCRALALAPGGEIHDARGRLDALSGAGRAALPDEAIVAMEVGLVAAERGDVSRALTSFERARALAPSWANSEYNRGVALASLGRGQEAAAALERYLELRPDAPDALTVSQMIGRLESLALRGGPSPGMAAALGVLVPGMGHFYSGRPIGGLTVLALAGGAMAAGLFIQEVDVRCLTAVEGGQPCPADQVVSRRHERPNLMLAIGVAGTISVLGALEAFLDARDRRAPPAFREARGLELEGPSLDVRSERVDLSFFALRFR